ncbi:hypothetical protein BHM03_00055244 [Ensete ventricosum]|nr:hypothetical protein BHM03_00055244 [Ensete ventricosum]
MTDGNVSTLISYEPHYSTEKNIFIFLYYQVCRQKLPRSFENIRVVSNRMALYEKGHLVADKVDLSSPYDSSRLIVITWKNVPPSDMAAPIHDRSKAPNGLTMEMLG